MYIYLNTYLGIAVPRPVGSREELDTLGVLLAKDLGLVPLDEDLKRLDHQLSIEPVEL